VGVGVYANAAHADLTHAVTDVEALHALMGAEFVGEPLRNPGRAEVDAYLGSIAPISGGGPLVLVWSGHGMPAPGSGLRLLTADSGTDLMAGVLAAEVVGRCAQVGAGQVLVILDTCFSGGAVPSATEVAAAVLAAQPPDSDRLWVGVVASCQGVETATDGVFGERLRRLLEKGPNSAHEQRRWSVRNQYIRGEDLGSALLEDWDTDVQRPVFRREGNAWWMLPNPRFDPGAAEEVVEHLLRAARGTAIEERYSWFTGRTAEIDTIVGWVKSGQPGVRVVTGSPGTGKSAVAGRVVGVSNPIERQFLATQDESWTHADPGERSVTANVHARGKTADQIAGELDGQLVRAGMLQADESGRRNAAQLIGTLQNAAGGPDWQLPVVVVDGLDEARGQAFTIAQDLLVRLAPHAAVIVATRDLPRPSGDEASVTLIGALDPVEVMDLDTEPWLGSGLDALVGYVTSRLADVHELMDADAVAAHLRETAFADEGYPFLLARLVTDQLRGSPIATNLPGWQDLVAGSMEAAFELDLAKVPAPRHRSLPADVSLSAFARGLLTALTWGLGAGFPEAEWTAVASATLTDPESGSVAPADLDWVLDYLGRYVVQDGQNGVAVYRIAHQGLADRLRTPFAARANEVFDPAAPTITRALLSRYRDLLVAGIPAAHPSYLWLHAWRHAAADSEGLVLMRELAELDAALLPDVAMTALDQSTALGRWRRDAEALPPAEEAVTIYRDLATNSPARLPDLAAALNNLGICYAELGRRAEALPVTEESVALRRDLAAENPAFLPDLANALNNLGIRYAELGRRAEALPVTEESVALRRDLAADNPAFLPDLAGALTNLGIRYSELGRRAEALPVTEEAVQLYRDLAADNPAHLPDLARVLGNLGIRYSELGRRAEALPVTEEAAQIYRGLAADNPAFLPDIAGALGNLGISYADLGRRADALPVTEESAQIYRGLAADNPAFIPDLARGLNNLGVRYAELGRRTEALPITEEAVQIYRDLAADNPAFIPDLASALNNLGIRYTELGRHSDALPVTEQAVALRRDLAADNPAFNPDLAGALINLGVSYAALGRHADALPVTQESLQIYRDLATDNPAFTPDLAMALNNLGIRHGDLGQHAEALPVAQEAVQLYRDLAADNPAFTPDLAGALINLGVSYADLGQHAEALPVAQEAVQLYRDLAADNPTMLRNLATALTNADGYLHALDRPDEGGAAWRAVLSVLPESSRALLLVLRSQRADDGHPEAATWLTEALAATGDDPDLVGAARDEVRRHRVSDTRFDQAWEDLTTQPIPDWTHIDARLVAVAREWIGTPTYNTEREYLADHPELLDPAADAAVDEAMLGIPADEAERYQSLRRVARTDGITAAYRPVMLLGLASQFVDAPASIQRELLQDRRDDVFDETVTQTVEEYADAEGRLGPATRALALLRLAANPDQSELLDQVLTALENPATFPEVLRRTAEQAVRNLDQAPLTSVAVCAMAAASTNAAAATAAVYYAVAATMNDDPETASEALRQAREWDPGPAGRDAWITMLSGLGQHQPAINTLIPRLLVPVSGGLDTPDREIRSGPGDRGESP
jgi:tetratricopeptide (TPR) repeat protein